MPEPAQPEINGIQCVSLAQRVPHAQHGWMWGPVERQCPGLVAPAQPMRADPNLDLSDVTDPPAHWWTRHDEDGDPYGSVCFCEIGEDHGHDA